MNLKEAIQPKTLELETALGLQKPHEELLKIYKELKELQYKKSGRKCRMFRSIQNN